MRLKAVEVTIWRTKCVNWWQLVVTFWNNWRNNALMLIKNNLYQDDFKGMQRGGFSMDEITTDLCEICFRRFFFANA